jgi:hypothetical protein
MGLSQAKYAAPWTSKIKRSKGLGFRVTKFFFNKKNIDFTELGEILMPKTHFTVKKTCFFFNFFFLKIKKKKNIHE